MKTTAPLKKIEVITAILIALPLSGHLFFHPSHPGTSKLHSECDHRCFPEVIHCPSPLANDNALRFSTNAEDDEPALLSYGYRYYNSQSGNWLVRDPLGENAGPNVYAFVSGNPVSHTDDLGLF